VLTRVNTIITGRPRVRHYHHGRTRTTLARILSINNFSETFDVITEGVDLLRIKFLTGKWVDTSNQYAVPELTLQSNNSVNNLSILITRLPSSSKKFGVLYGCCTVAVKNISNVSTRTTTRAITNNNVVSTTTCYFISSIAAKEDVIPFKVEGIFSIGITTHHIDTVAGKNDIMAKTTLMETSTIKANQNIITIFAKEGISFFTVKNVIIVTTKQMVHIMI